MKTVVENNTDMDKHYQVPKGRKNHLAERYIPGRSCFYDFGAKSPMEFTGFSNDADSKFIKKIMDYFQL